LDQWWTYKTSEIFLIFLLLLLLLFKTILNSVTNDLKSFDLKSRIKITFAIFDFDLKSFLDTILVLISIIFHTILILFCAFWVKIILRCKKICVDFAAVDSTKKSKTLSCKLYNIFSVLFGNKMLLFKIDTLPWSYK